MSAIYLLFLQEARSKQRLCYTKSDLTLKEQDKKKNCFLYTISTLEVLSTSNLLTFQVQKSRLNETKKMLLGTRRQSLTVYACVWPNSECKWTSIFRQSLKVIRRFDSCVFMRASEWVCVCVLFWQQNVCADDELCPLVHPSVCLCRSHPDWRVEI